MNVTEYMQDSGELRMMLSFPDIETYQINMQDGVGYLEGHHDGNFSYVDASDTPPSIKARPASPVTLSDLTLLGVPAGSTLTINGERYEGVDGDVELEFPLPGTYRLRVDCFPYKDWEWEVIV